MIYKIDIFLIKNYCYIVFRVQQLFTGFTLGSKMSAVGSDSVLK